MKLKDFLPMYDNWNGITRINDDNLETIVIGVTWQIWEHQVPFEPSASVKDYDKLFKMEVVAFGFYDEELCVRVR